MPLTPKQRRFIAEYLKDTNATQAAIRAGYSPKTAEQQGSRLLRNVQVAEAVKTKTEKQLAKAEITAERVLQEIGRIAFLDIRGLFDEKGRFKAAHQLDDDTAHAIAELIVLKENLIAGDGRSDQVWKLKPADKLAALTLLAKRFALVKEQVEVTGLDELVERLTRARKRVG
jgi:phage terminase small subunit